jgi:hypothetical protein
MYVGLAHRSQKQICRGSINGRKDIRSEHCPTDTEVPWQEHVPPLSWASARNISAISPKGLDIVMKPARKLAQILRSH